jgi:hypothetical protein
MKALRELLGDRKRAQRGSVLSGVLIIVAFLAIIAGALMTELSTNLLLSRALVHRVANEATLNSAMELALDKLQSSPLSDGCPTVNAVTLNGLTAAVSYLSCYPAVDVRSPDFTSIAFSSPFNVDGTHDVVNGQDLYLVGDSNGGIYQFRFGNASPLWSRNLRAQLTGPPLMMADVSSNPPRITNLIPTTGSAACQGDPCVELLTQGSSNSPVLNCEMPANANVTSRPAAGVAFPRVAYFGDRSGTLFAYDATASGDCELQDSRATLGNAAIVAGPIVFRNGNRDEIYFVTSRGSFSSGQLIHFEFRGGGNPTLAAVSGLTLPYANPVGLALEKIDPMTEKATVAARLVVTFAAGQMAMVRIDGSYNPGLLATASLGTGVSAAPFWCWCTGRNLIAAGGLNGTLYLLDTNLNRIGSYVGGSPVRTTPGSDDVGDWFFGSDDGYLHEVQQPAGQTALVQRATYGPFGGRVGSSVQVGECLVGICVYLGAENSHAYIVPLNAWDAILTACLSSSPPACSSTNPRLWTQVEVGSAGNPRTVHVGGWSYYSP